MFIFCDEELWHGDAGGEGDGELFFEGLAVFFELEAEVTAKDDALGTDGGDDGAEAGGDAAGDFDPIGLFADL